jgi:hypothetical protein
LLDLLFNHIDTFFSFLYLRLNLHVLLADYLLGSFVQSTYVCLLNILFVLLNCLNLTPHLTYEVLHDPFLSLRHVFRLPAPFLCLLCLASNDCLLETALPHLTRTVLLHLVQIRIVLVHALLLLESNLLALLVEPGEGLLHLALRVSLLAHYLLLQELVRLLLLQEEGADLRVGLLKEIQIFLVLMEKSRVEGFRSLKL